MGGQHKADEKSPPAWAKALHGQLNGKLDDLFARDEGKTSAFADIRHIVRRQLNFSALRDECQIRIIGFPDDLKSNLPRAVELILLALGFPHSLPIVRSTHL